MSRDEKVEIPKILFGAYQNRIKKGWLAFFFAGIYTAQSDLKAA
jgi:hypothetical protein